MGIMGGAVVTALVSHQCVVVKASYVGWYFDSFSLLHYCSEKFLSLYAGFRISKKGYISTFFSGMREPQICQS